jgi:hypothetical protein
MPAHIVFTHEAPSVIFFFWCVCPPSCTLEFQGKGPVSCFAHYTQLASRMAPESDLPTGNNAYWRLFPELEESCFTFLYPQ